MKYMRKRIIACFLCLTLVISMGNGFGLSYVYASENKNSIPMNVQSEESLKKESITPTNVSGNIAADNTSDVLKITTSVTYDNDIETDVDIDGGSNDIVVNFTGITIEGNVTIHNGQVTFDHVIVNGDITVIGGSVTVMNDSNVNGTLSAKDATDATEITIDSSTVTTVTDINLLKIINNVTFTQFTNVENLVVEDASINIDISGTNPVAPVFNNITGQVSASLHLYTGKGEIPVNADGKLILPKFTGTIDLGKDHERFPYNGADYDVYYGNQDKSYIKLNDAYYLRDDFVKDEETGEYTLPESAEAQQVSEENLWQNEWNNSVQIEYISSWGNEDEGIKTSYLDLSKITTPFVEFGSKQVAANLIAGRSPYIQPIMHNEKDEYYRTDMDGRVYLDQYQVQVNRYVNDPDNMDNTAKTAFDNAWHNDDYCSTMDVGYVGSIDGAISFIEADLSGEGASAPYYEIHYHSNQTVGIDVSGLNDLKGIRIISDSNYDEEQDKEISPETNLQSIKVKEGQVIEFCKVVSGATEDPCSISGKGEISFLDCRIDQSMVGNGEVIVATYNNTAFESLKNVDTYAISNNAYFTKGITNVNKVELRGGAQIFGGSGAQFDLPNVSSKKENITDHSKDDPVTLEGSGFDLRLFGCEEGSAKTTFNLTGTYDLGKGWNTHWNNDDTFERVYYLEIQREDGGSDRENYVHVTDKWYHFDNGEIGEEATDLDVDSLQIDSYTQGVVISYYDNSEPIDAFNHDYDLWHIQDKRVDKNGLANKQVCSVEQDTLGSIEYNLCAKFSDGNYNFTDQTDWNGTRTVQMIGDEVGIYAVCYDDNTVTDYYAVLKNPMDYEGFVITKDDYENYVNNDSIDTEGERIQGSLSSVLTKLKDENYVYIRNKLGVDTQGDTITIPDNAHVIIDCGQNPGKINRIDLGANAECILSGTFNGDIQYNGDTDSQLALRNIWLDGSITGNEEGVLTFIEQNTLCGISKIDSCNLQNSDNLDIIPNQDGNYEKVSFHHIYGNNGFHLSYSGYPKNDGQILVPEFTGNIELGLNSVRTQDGTEYDVWYGQNDTRYILIGEDYHEITDELPEGYIIYNDQPADITEGDVWNHLNNISVTYYTPETFYSDDRETIEFYQDEDYPDDPYENTQYMSFGSLEHGFDLASQYKVDCWDYGNYFIDIDGRLHNRDYNFLGVMGIDEENFKKVGHDGFYYYAGYPTATAEHAMVIAKCAGFPYTGIEVNREGETFANLVVPDNIKALAILSNNHLGYYPTYTVDSITLHDDQLLVFQALHTENSKPLNISMSDSGTSGTVRFLHSRVNQVVNGTKDITVEVEEDNAFKALTNFKQLFVNSGLLAVEDILDGIDTKDVSDDSSLIMWKDYSVNAISNQTFTGSAIKPEVSLSSTTSDYQMDKDIDYEVLYTNNTNAGKAKVTIKGLGIFEFFQAKQTEFNILQKNIADSKITVAPIVDQVYIGNAINPALAIIDSARENKKLVVNTDFTVIYQSNIVCGTATVKISGKGNYTGTIYRTFKIIPKTIKPTVSKISSQYYSGKALKPSVTVKDGTKTLKLNTDYTVSYKNNTNVGTATITITGKGNYKFTKTASFAIALKNGATYTVGAFQYKVTNASGTVTLVKSTNTKATSITVANTVKIGSKTCVISAIGDKAMINHKKLTKVTIGTGVTAIGAQAFASCGKLKNIVISSSKLKTVGKNAFNGIYSKATIKVPKAKLSAYQKLLKNKGQKSTVKITK